MALVGDVNLIHIGRARTGPSIIKINFITYKLYKLFCPSLFYRSELRTKDSRNTFQFYAGCNWLRLAATGCDWLRLAQYPQLTNTSGDTKHRVSGTVWSHKLNTWNVVVAHPVYGLSHPWKLLKHTLSQLQKHKEFTSRSFYAWLKCTYWNGVFYPIFVPLMSHSQMQDELDLSLLIWRRWEFFLSVNKKEGTNYK